MARLLVGPSHRGLLPCAAVGGGLILLLADVICQSLPTADLRAGGPRHEGLRYGARLELGMRSFLEAGGESFTLVTCVNTMPEWVDTLERFVSDWLAARKNDAA